MRRIAVLAVSVSMTAIAMAIITIPMLYSYAHDLQSRVIDEAAFCRVGFPLTIEYFRQLQKFEKIVNVRVEAR